MEKENNNILWRLQRSKRMVMRMCEELRPPTMSLPIQDDDEDIFIFQTIDDVLRLIEKWKDALGYIAEGKIYDEFQSGDSSFDELGRDIFPEWMRKIQEMAKEALR